jgi:hypothetical protein
MRYATFGRLMIAASVSILLAGCSGPDLPPLGKVKGVVTLDGAPYPNARVAFTPKRGRPSEGITDSSGKYELTYMPAVRGAEIGEHTVSITTLYESPENPDDARPFKDPIPPKYNERSTLKVTVDKGENQHDFPLVSK